MDDRMQEIAELLSSDAQANDAVKLFEPLKTEDVMAVGGMMIPVDAQSSRPPNS